MSRRNAKCPEKCMHRIDCMPNWFDTPDCLAAWKASGLTPTGVVGLIAEGKDLRAEVERLRAALEELEVICNVEADWHDDPAGHPTTLDSMRRAVKIARAALGWEDADEKA